MQKINPCLWLVGNSEEAAKLYTGTFKNSRIKKTSYYTESTAKVSGIPAGTVMTVDIEIAGQFVQVLNGGPYFEHTSSMSLFVTCGSREEFDKIHKALSPGGKTLIEVGEYPFSKRYGFFSDKFGVHWQLFLEEGAEQKIIPSIIFGGDKKGVGPKAIDFYLSLFKNSKKIVDSRYEKGEPGLEGSVKHARLDLDGSELIIMDSGHSENMKMTGALSLVINCKDQAEVDRFWGAIGKAGKEQPCGWIEDQFGVAWQVVPVGLDDLVSGPDPVKTERAVAAMLQMKKLDIAKLRQAYMG